MIEPVQGVLLNMILEAFLAGQARGRLGPDAFQLWWESDSPSAIRLRVACQSLDAK